MLFNFFLFALYHILKKKQSIPLLMTLAGEQFLYVELKCVTELKFSPKKKKKNAGTVNFLSFQKNTKKSLRFFIFLPDNNISQSIIFFSPTENHWPLE